MINNHGGAMLFKPFMREMMEKYPMSNLGKDCKIVTAEDGLLQRALSILPLMI